MNNNCRCCGLLSKRISQYCAGCGVYHYYDQCVDPYFNDPDAWCGKGKK